MPTPTTAAPILMQMNLLNAYQTLSHVKSVTWHETQVILGPWVHGRAWTVGSVGSQSRTEWESLGTSRRWKSLGCLREGRGKPASQKGGAAAPPKPQGAEWGGHGGEYSRPGLEDRLTAAQGKGESWLSCLEGEN